MKRYKFLREGLKSEYGDFVWEIGKWYKHDGEVKLCEGGFHCSKEIGQAFSYVSGEILAEVEVRGKCDEGSDKDSWEEMRIVKAWHWKKVNSVSIAIFSAELYIENYEKQYPNDNRPRLAIEAAKNWLDNPTKENQESAESAARSAESAAWSAARLAAWSAARSAARSAESAAWSAAWSARSSAESAARSAAWSAASAARSAAWSAARSAESAALSAESAAWSAARKKIYQRFDEELIKLEEYDKR